MSGTDSRSPERHTVAMSRRNLLLSAAALGALIPATAEVVARLTRNAAAAPAPARQRPAAAPQVSTPPPVTSAAPAVRARLAGKVVVIDPGHNPHNPQHVAQISALVNAGGFLKACDTVGAETDAGYPEFDFTLDVARRARSILRAAGAKVILTQNGNTTYGPCINQRAGIGNRAHADAAISIHADGGPPDGYGFAVLVPVLVHNAVADNSMIIEPSRQLAGEILTHFAAATGQRRSTYLGSGGIQPRADLGGLNLSTVPKVFIECANMRNAGDAAKVTDEHWRHAAARGIADSIAAFVTAT
ncbi:MAG: N-acetylmuramoyl-L-alanine amidase [Streptosporangiaceae bacterium]